jgi:hypothetical protein
MSHLYRTLMAVPRSSYCPELRAVIDRAILEGFPLPIESTLNALDVLIRTLISIGYLNLRDLILNFAYNDENCRLFSMINIANPSGPLATENNSYYNLFARSEEFDNTWWSRVSSTVTANDTIAPDGTLTADRFNITGVTARLQIGSGQYIPLLGKKYNFSIYVKPDTRYIITLRDQLSTPNGATFNLSTLTATNTGNGTNATITTEANGFYRCSVDFMPATTNINVGIGNSPIPSQCWMWGAQLTEGYGVKTYQKTVISYSALQYEGRGFYGNINWNQSIPNTYNIDTGYNPFTDGINYTLDNASMEVITQYNLGTNNYVGSSGGNTVNNNLRIGTAGATSRINSSGNLFSTVNTNTIGYIALNRIDSVNHKVVINSTILDNTIVSTSIPNANHFLYSYNSLNQGGLFSYYSMGAEVVIEGQLFRTAYNNYLLSIGLTPIA